MIHSWSTVFWEITCFYYEKMKDTAADKKTSYFFYGLWYALFVQRKFVDNIVSKMYKNYIRFFKMKYM